MHAEAEEVKTWRHKPEGRKCPGCHVLDASTGLTGGRGPEDGDLYICIMCGAVNTLRDGRLTAMSEADMAALPPESQFELENARYVSQIIIMRRRADEWRQAHPGADINVQFNYPSPVFIISPISSAVERHVVSTNADGLALLKAMWPWDDVREPTVFMVKLALEATGEGE